MIYDVDSILQKGLRWPPEAEKTRLTLYKQNENLFDGNHTAVYTGLLRLFHENAAEHSKIVMCLNWHRRLSTLWPDLLIGELPEIKVSEGNQKAIDQLLIDTGMWPETYKALIDTSRFGTGPLKAYVDEAGLPHALAVAPSRWFPVVDSSGKVIEHLLAWQVDKTLNCEIHRKGEIETRTYQIIDGKIASEATDIEINKEAKETYGIDDYLLVPLCNLTTTTNQWGIDDYTSLDPIIKRLETRLTRLGRILDAHSEPAMGVPEDAVTRNPETGEMHYDTNLRIFPMGEGQKPPQYITWDGQLSASFQEVTFLMDQLYPAFGQSVSGTAESGTSLRLRMMAPLKRVERLRLNIDPAIKKLVWLLAKLSDIQLDPKEISINWKDGLPEDNYQQSQIEMNDVTSGITSKKAAAMRRYGWTEEQVDADQLQIKEELALQGGMI
jgi:hypothetical protein